MLLRILKPVSRHLLLAACMFACLGAPADAQDAGVRIYVVTHVDIAGQGPAAEAAKLLLQFAADSRGDKGAVRFEVLREPTRLNHFTLVEIWQSRQDFEAHLAASHSKAFREKIQPILGSPFDERLHVLLP